MTMVLVISVVSSTFAYELDPIERMEYTPKEVMSSLQAGYGFVEDGALNGNNDRLYTHTNFVSGVITSNGIPIVWCGEYTINFAEVKLSNNLHKSIRSLIDNSMMKSDVISKNNFTIQKFNQNLLQNVMDLKREVFVRFKNGSPRGITLQKFEIISIGTFDGEAL